MSKRSLKIGKDVTGKKQNGFFRSEKEREDYEKWKQQKLAEDLAKEEKDAQREQDLQGKKIASKMQNEREPTGDDLAKQKAEVLTGMRRLKVKKVVLKEERK